MVGAIVNDEYVPVNYVLQNKDRIRIITNEFSFGPRMNWVDIAHTSLAKRKIQQFGKK